MSRTSTFLGAALGATLCGLFSLAPLATAQNATPDHAEGVEGELSQLNQRVSPGVVAIQARRGNNGLGSGIVISDDGMILTSTSVVPTGTRTISLTLKGGRKVKAREVRRDSKLGAVLLKITGPSDLTALTLGDSGKLRPGQLVATFGNPFGTISRDGLPAMSLGVVSGLYPMPNDANGGLAIETDAAINPGSFGGPLVDEQGRVVGLVVPAYRNDRWLGLARPIDELKGLIDGSPAAPVIPLAQLNNERGRVGIYIFQDDDSTENNGALIERVLEGGAAAKAGVRKGDIVRNFGRTRIRSSKALAAELRKVKAGQEISIRIVRKYDGQEWARVFKVTAEGSGEAPQAGTRPYLGVFLSQGDGQLAIDRVAEDGPAAKAGLKGGDQLIDFETMDDLRSFMSDKRPGQTVTIRVNRDGWERSVKLTIGAIPSDDQARRPAPTPRATPKKPTPAPRAKAKNKGFLGVYLQDTDNGFGVAVTRIMPGSPAEKGGMLAGDVVVKVGNLNVADLESFTEELSYYGAGQTVKLGVARNGQAVTLNVTLGDRNGTAPAPTPPVAKKPGWLGISVTEENGVLTIVQIVDGSPAASSKLTLGNRIISIDNQSVESIEQLGGVLRGCHAGQTIRIKVLNNDDRSQIIEVELTERG
ncbi:MAG: PDZ domain-containing protein [Planctomycetota bacterium]